jgi:hypothetical protein
MSGGLQPDFRQGNRSEYLAQYLLSYLGTSVLVPRQEDVGIDFHCAISVANGQIEEIKEQFHVQIKSNITDEIEFGSIVKSGSKQKKKWKKHELDWLFNLDNPLFIGIVNKDEGSIELYTTSFMWFNYWTKEFLTIKFLPNTPSDHSAEIHALADEDITEWAKEIESSIPKIMTIVPMGPPVIRLTKENVRVEATLFKIKEVLRLAIMIEHSNITYKKLRLPYFNWLLKIATNSTIQGGYFYSIDKVLREEVGLYKNLTPILISLALLYKNTQDARFETILNALKLVPKNLIPENIKTTLDL